MYTYPAVEEVHDGPAAVDAVTARPTADCHAGSYAFIFTASNVPYQAPVERSRPTPMMMVARSRRCETRSGQLSRVATITDTQAAEVTPTTVTVELRFPPKLVDHHATEAMTPTPNRPHVVGINHSNPLRGGPSTGAGASKSDDSTGGT